MTGLAWWSQTAASNATQDPSVNWAEGMAPSAVNDSARGMMASTAKWRDDISGAIVTGGTSTAYTVASYQSFDNLTRLANQVIAFTPHTTNGATVTLNVDSLGAKPLRSAPSTDLPAGTLIQGTPYSAVYNSSDGAFYLKAFFGQPYAIPIGGVIDFTGSTTPNSGFVFPAGQAISRTTYATYFSLVSTTYGTGDGSTTFNVPDLTGRIVAMKEASATRLTSTYFGGNSTNLGATGGAESQTLTAAQIPSLPVTMTAGTNGSPKVVFSGGGSKDIAAGAFGYGDLTGTGGVTWTANNGVTAAGHNIVQPTIILNKILRVI